MKKYVLKESRFSGLYENQYKTGGYGWRWTPWKTVSRHDTLEVATDVAATASGLSRRAVFFGGAIVATNDGLGWKPRRNDDGR